MQNIGKQVLSQLLPWLGKITRVRLIKIIVIGVDVNGCNWAVSRQAAFGSTSGQSGLYGYDPKVAADRKRRHQRDRWGQYHNLLKKPLPR